MSGSSIRHAVAVPDPSSVPGLWVAILVSIAVRAGLVVAHDGGEAK